jgi:hypothetical protein
VGERTGADAESRAGARESRPEHIASGREAGARHAARLLPSLRARQPRGRPVLLALRARAGARRRRAAGESTSTISLGTELAEAEPDEPLADSGLVEALPVGSALLVVKRGPNAGSRFLLDSDLTTAGRHPEATSFSTT